MDWLSPIFSPALAPLWLPMTLFAMACSASPGPVNIIATSTGACFGFWRCLPWVVGASAGFSALMLLIGLGPGAALAQGKSLQTGLRIAGSLFLLWLAWTLARGPAHASAAAAPLRQPPGPLQGAIAQWINPKAWIVIVAGVASYTVPGPEYATSVWLLSGIFFVVCLPSIGMWGLLGHAARGLLQSPAALRRFNRMMGLALASSIVTLWL